VQRKNSFDLFSAKGVLKLKNALDRILESVKDEYDTQIKVNTIRGATLNS
jgi:hypothetical protein